MFFDSKIANISLCVVFALCLIAGGYLIFKSFRKKEIEVITIDTNVIGSTNIVKHLEAIKKQNPGLDEQVIRTLYLSFRAVVFGYGSYTDSVIVCETKDPEHKNEKVNFVLAEKNNTDAEENLVNSSKSPGSPNKKEILFKLNLNQENGENLLELSEFDKFIIDKNEMLIEDLLARSNMNLDQDTAALLIAKSLQTSDKTRTHVSPLEIMFSKYVKYFILKQ